MITMGEGKQLWKRRSRVQCEDEGVLIYKWETKEKSERIPTLTTNMASISFHKIMPNHEPAVTSNENPCVH